jgi:hypothetical protein
MASCSHRFQVEQGCPGKQPDNLLVEYARQPAHHGFPKDPPAAQSVSSTCVPYLAGARSQGAQGRRSSHLQQQEGPFRVAGRVHDSCPLHRAGRYLKRLLALRLL